MNGATTPPAKMTPTSLLTELESIVGRDHVRPPDPKSKQFVIDGLAPQVIIHPASYDEVAAVMSFANQRGLAVVPQCEGRVTWIGNIPARYDIALSVARLNAVVEYEPADLTLTCQAGATLDHLNGPLSENGQIIPIASLTVGSHIGRLLALPMRESNLTWGTARDITIGLRVVTADGRIIRTGGNVVKNVAGYDLTKLFIGSMGTLGVIVEASFKLAPAPQAEERVDLEFVSVADACRLASDLRGRGLSLRQVKLNRSKAITEAGPEPRSNIRLSLELAGTAPAVERSRGETTDTARKRSGTMEKTEWPKREGPFPAWTAGHPTTCVASVLPTLVPLLVDEVDREAPGAFIDASPLEGSVSMTWLGDGLDAGLVCRVRAITARLGGTLVVTGCHPDLKRHIDVFGDVPPKTLDLMRRIKQQFDPNGILSPGRFIGRL